MLWRVIMINMMLGVMMMLNDKQKEKELQA
jgi:hypothetical protein